MIQQPGLERSYDAASIIDRLRRRFGSGVPGDVRERFYAKLGNIIEANGESAYMCVASCAADAAGKEQPDRYFAKAVTARLREQGFTEAIEL